MKPCGCEDRYVLRGVIGTNTETEEGDLWIYGGDGVDENLSVMFDSLRGQDVVIRIEVL